MGKFLNDRQTILHIAGMVNERKKQLERGFGREQPRRVQDELNHLDDCLGWLDKQLVEVLNKEYGYD